MRPISHAFYKRKREEKVRTHASILQCVNVFSQGCICNTSTQDRTPPHQCAGRTLETLTGASILNTVVRVDSEVSFYLVLGSSYCGLRAALPTEVSPYNPLLSNDSTRNRMYPHISCSRRNEFAGIATQTQRTYK